MFSRAMSSGVLTVKNRKKVARLTPSRIEHTVDDAADEVVQHVAGDSVAPAGQHFAARVRALAPAQAARGAISTARAASQHDHARRISRQRPPHRPVPLACCAHSRARRVQPQVAAHGRGSGSPACSCAPSAATRPTRTGSSPSSTARRPARCCTIWSITLLLLGAVVQQSSAARTACRTRGSA